MKEVKKIIILTTVNFPYGSPGGNFIRNLSTGLRLVSKFQIEVWIQSGHSRPDANFQNYKLGTINNVIYRYIGGYTMRPRNRIGKFLNDIIGIVSPGILLIKNMGNINSIIIYNSSAIGFLSTLLISKLLRIQTVKIVPEWYEKKSVIKSFIYYFKWWNIIFGIKYLNFYFDKIIVLSTYLKKYYVSNGFNEERIFILPNLVNFDEFSNEHGLINNTNLPKERVLIGYSGTPVFKDGILDLLHAFSIVVKSLSNVELLIIGDISQTKSIIPDLRIKARNYGIPENKIHFSGLVEFNYVPKLLHSCDILVLARPSGRFSEAGFPTKLGEYFACKKPVVLTKVGDIPTYFVDKENAVLVEPDNPESISEGLKFLILNSNEGKKIGLKGYDWAKNNLEYKRVTMNVFKFLSM